MTLAEIRQAADLESLKPAIKYLCDNMDSMPWGAFCAYKRTLESQGDKLGLPYKRLNLIAENYQVFGELVEVLK